MHPRQIFHRRRSEGSSHARLLRLLRTLAAYLVAGLSPLPTLWAAERVALVIGNNRYDPALPVDQRPNLVNPARDAGAVRDLLSEMGFDVILVKDATVDQFNEALEKFKTRATGARVGLVYYAGHGFEVDGKNYLLPVDARLQSKAQLRTQAVAIATVLEDMGAARITAKLLVLDCCRDDPFSTRSWRSQRGLGRDGKPLVGLGAVDERDLPEATMVMYSAAPGQQAQDGAGDNSPFTAAFVAEMRRGGANCMDAFFKISDAVKLNTGYQEPWIKFDGAGRTFRELVFLPKNNPPPPLPPSGNRLAGASKASPYANSLGMEFVPAGTPEVLFCRWETRVKDFEEFIQRSGYDMSTGEKAYTVESDEKGGTAWKQAGGNWRNPRFPKPQGEDHPVVCVSLNDAKAFCDWLTGHERKLGLLPAGARYAVPSDEKWSRAAGDGKYPWGENWPPSGRDGNYCGTESKVGVAAKAKSWTVIGGLDDGAARTAPVGNYRANRFGLFDMGGNVWEWCDSYYKVSMNSDEARKAYPVLEKETANDGTPYRVLRGGSWLSDDETFLRSSFRFTGPPTGRSDDVGFRCVLVISGG